MSQLTNKSLMMSMKDRTTVRLTKEIRDIKDESQTLTGIFVTQCNESLFNWYGYMSGPIGSIWENVKLNFEIIIPSTYPFHAPKFIFLHKNIFHPNISNTYQPGYVWLTALHSGWSPSITIAKLLVTIQNLLAEPNLHEIYIPNNKACKLLRKSYPLYCQEVQDSILKLKKEEEEENITNACHSESQSLS